jgi:aspartate aminotransferase
MVDSVFPPHPLVARESIRGLSASRIREIANAGMDRTDIAAFWFGESDRPTPDFIRKAAVRSLEGAETFYTQNLGRPALREAIAAYESGLHGRPVDAARMAVTGSGVSALMLASQLVVGPGDRVVVVTPIWPNIAEIPRILGAEVERQPLAIANARWQLDLDRLLDALTPETRMLIVNSPNNPTGWTIEPEAQRVLLEHCRRHGIWILSDEVYERLVFRPGLAAAPSFLGIAEPDDRLLVVNSFSKAWRMTGWRIGWLTIPAALEGELTKIIEYNTSCVPGFVQQGALAALTDPRGEMAVVELREGLVRSRALLLDGLGELEGVSVPEADGAMYAFFRLAGHEDSVALAKRLVAEVGLGLAPGSSFGPEGEGYLRWCFAAAEAKIADGLARLRRFLAR